MRREERQRLLDGHLQHVVNVLALVAHFQRFAVVALAAADVARHVNVRQKVHFDFHDAVALARFAAAALDVEAEPAAVVPAQLRVRRRRKQRADQIEQPRVRRGIRARRLADRALVDVDDLVEMLDALHAGVRPGADARAVQIVQQPLFDDFVDQTRFARAGNAGHADEHAERDRNVDVLEVVCRRAANG